MRKVNNLDWIRFEAIKRGLKFIQIAKGVSINYSYFICYLNGYRNPPKNFEKRIRKYFTKLDTNQAGGSATYDNQF